MPEWRSWLRLPLFESRELPLSDRKSFYGKFAFAGSREKKATLVPDLESSRYQEDALSQGTVPVGTTPDEGGVVPAPETTSHSQPSQLVPALNFARQALDASSDMSEDEENKERTEKGLSREK